MSNNLYELAQQDFFGYIKYGPKGSCSNCKLNFVNKHLYRTAFEIFTTKMGPSKSPLHDTSCLVPIGNIGLTVTRRSSEYY